MKHFYKKEVKELILKQLKGYLYEINSNKDSSASDYVSIEAYNGVEYAFIYEISRSIRDIVKNEKIGGNYAIFFATNDPKKGINKNKILSFLENEISVVNEISNESSVTKFNQYAVEFSERVTRLNV